MKKIYVPLFFLILLSCKESGVQLAKPTTFLRYFNGGFQDQAQAIIETADKGFLILVNSGTVCTNATTCSQYRIKLIKTDAFGNLQKTIFFPEPVSADKDTLYNYQGFGLAAINNASGVETGYVITGREIYDTIINNNPTTASALLMITIDNTNYSATNGTPRAYRTFPIQANGLGVAVSKTGDFYIAGANLSNPVADMFATKINGSSFSPEWVKAYGSGGDVMAHKLFLDDQNGFLYWSATRTNPQTANSEMSLIKVSTTDGSTLHQFYNPNGNVTFNLTSADVCPFRNGFAMVGSYSLPGTATNYSKVAFASTDFNDNLLDSMSYTITPQNNIVPANSISSTHEGGLLMLNTLQKGTDTNYHLIKVDSHGVMLWTKDYGGQFPDNGVQVLQAIDGGYIVLGTTVLAGVSCVLLMKTDSDGIIQ
ncbi:MAG: hypothetical protein JST48_01645 [Bacteroidetes bacterium]|nr:hypothetical protein [Bacteroidota bacterium]